MADRSVGARLRGIWLAVWHFVTGAPLTYGWLIALTITTIVQNELSGRQLHSVLLHRSTNIHSLGTDPLDVLFSSLLWIDGRNLEPYFLLFTLFLAPVEHWLGHLRWLTVGLTAHILATYISEGILYFAIEQHDAAERLVHARDIGVSYFMVGVMAVLTYHIVSPWRWGYVGVLFVIFGFPLLTMDPHQLNFTAIGHFASLLIGLCFYPMAQERKRPPWSPARFKGAVQRAFSREQEA
ncbi:rhomboid-like protein [Mycobacterium rhizamassiliense]|uniref:rhomboid-like protein n=1 Tax=Mycobacterium rhizamassiliense TaxID=1841860 RepID=UPI000D3E46B8|nr:rhomboid-like protein [Mycobacterium rhizamassiliense]